MDIAELTEARDSAIVTRNNAERVLNHVQNAVSKPHSLMTDDEQLSLLQTIIATMSIMRQTVAIIRTTNDQIKNSLTQ